ncbi:glucokinase [Porticoccus sp. GXU_MW_L64]
MEIAPINQPVKGYMVADIGGTNARFAMVGGDGVLRNINVLSCSDYPHIKNAILEYIASVSPWQIEGICLAIAGPVDKDEINLLNNHWHFSQAQLQQDLNVTVTVINDFTAQALSIDALPEDGLEWLGEARPSGGQIRLVIGPGTGLGVAGLMPDNQIIPSEGGHVGFSPTSDHQVKLLQVLWEQRHQRVSVERLLSGQGLENLYWANAMLHGMEKKLSAKQISALADAGEELALQAVGDLFDILASTAGDMAMTLWASDGVYLTGGVLEKLYHLFDAQRFRRHFEEKGRFKSYCASLPIALIRAEHPGLIGCYAAARAYI